jgi:hypothetical protein
MSPRPSASGTAATARACRDSNRKPARRSASSVVGISAIPEARLRAIGPDPLYCALLTAWCARWSVTPWETDGGYKHDEFPA